MSARERIEQRLAALSPESVALVDDSQKHAGHAGAQGGGGHYELIIVAHAFEGKSLLARHRMVYEALQDLLRRDIHALSIKAYTPREI